MSASPTHDPRSTRAFTEGIRAVVPILVGVVPFGLIFGVTAAELPVDDLVGWASSVLIFAGASQLAAVDLLADQAAPVVVVLTVMIINARHLMYSASLEPHFRDLPRRDKLLLPYVMTDQAYAVSILRFEGSDLASRYRKWYYLGAGLALWTTWQITTSLGIIAGDIFPSEWRLDFAVPLVFLALLVPAVRDRAGLVAALSAATIALLGRDLPYNLGLVVGAVAGVAMGTIADRERSK